ncbi:Pyridine nucleotide-disulfide oxidoreductase domain-containing protein 1 [Frankliniella fusca]|uniref:Pyridine nucleotide-disulfide oxidoreductase domain-containing protein 1 n=1 Tax=Frankliniella fusca TaxID=407009 RepID=A0AAE1LXL2_9NEOP|nr:Pyridine nucleotide-disulfide oxidoreductase domain-containing protein 1 [Frankliniella fusca]
MTSAGDGEALTAPFVVVGGGIAGVSCSEALAVLRPQDDVLLLSASALIKAATNVQPLTKYLVKFEVEEQAAAALTQRCPTVRVVQDAVVALQPGAGGQGVLVTEQGRRVAYGRLCVCSGARPKPVHADHPLVLTVRDTESVRALQTRLAGARRVLVVGNGGIATELVHELRGVEVVWVVRHDHISAAFVDAGAAEFLMPAATQEGAAEKAGQAAVEPVVKRMRFTEARAAEAGGGAGRGAALGPDWHERWELRGGQGGRQLTIEYGCEVQQLLVGDDLWPARAQLTNGKVIGADLVVSATGVTPNVEVFARGNPGLRLDAEDGGILVDEHMRSSVPGVFAAGDACTAGWAHAKHWFQMRLWTQARQMGAYAARCMAADAEAEGELPLQDFCFEMFTHVTRFFGHKVVLLGLHNGQKLPDGDWEMMLRAVKGKEYVKLVLQGGRVQGAVLIGDTDLEETFENLILDQVDVSHLGEDLLNPHVDVEDYFD